MKSVVFRPMVEAWRPDQSLVVYPSSRGGAWASTGAVGPRTSSLLTSPSLQAPASSVAPPMTFGPHTPAGTPGGGRKGALITSHDHPFLDLIKK
ncbi:unnamed protein product [Vitrella brassicaformis CCMP3155]|uniref:Uncharacterized protein n=1 Tax=Vitrella brassicaformis (strain CCMP3155) TaxID=1169540 RepID=A0A0G4FHE7_VITBC|nr:unnamed protein product [Vitrella brassicaformis CCMP3155]|eukprot:CEM12718.1 unnamed protein product [Vitrella brassicaformis CCMP3155]